MATLTKKDLLKAIEDMPMDAELREFEEFKELVKRMREAQYKEACLPTYEFDIELYRLRGRLESEVDEYLKKMEE